MSLLHRFSDPYEVVRHPQLEPEVKRAVLASWASDRAAVEGGQALRKLPRATSPGPVDDALAALKAFCITDGQSSWK